MSKKMVFVGFASCGCIHAAWIDRVDDDQSDVVAEMLRSGLKVVYQPLGDGVRLNANCGHKGIAEPAPANDAESARLREQVDTLTRERDAALSAAASDRARLAAALRDAEFSMRQAFATACRQPQGEWRMRKASVRPPSINDLIDVADILANGIDVLTARKQQTPTATEDAANALADGGEA